MDAEFKKRFLTETSETGRFIVKSLVTGKEYFIEAIDNSTSYHKIWGDVDPVTKSMQGTYGKKYKGSVSEDESLITKENGFDNILYTGVGGSPYSLIKELDKKAEEEEDEKI